MQNHSPDGDLGEKADLDGAILDTARRVFETYGVRRANIEDIATRAGVSRSTIYRRFPTKDDLFGHVVRREAERFFSTLDQATTGRDPREAVIEAFVLGVGLVQDSPLYSRIADSEPELFGMFSRSHVFPIRQFAGGIARTAPLRGRPTGIRPGQHRRHSAARRPGHHRLSVRPARHVGSRRRPRLRRPLSGPDHRSLAGKLVSILN